MDAVKPPTPPAPNDNGATDPIQAAVDYGIDVSQLRDNLALTVSERLRRHQSALETVEMCGIGSLLTTSPTVDAALADLTD